MGRATVQRDGGHGDRSLDRQEDTHPAGEEGLGRLPGGDPQGDEYAQVFGPVRMTKIEKKSPAKTEAQRSLLIGVHAGTEGVWLLEIMQKRNLLATSYSHNPSVPAPATLSACSEALRPSVGPPSPPPQHPSCPQPQKRPPHLCSSTSGSLSRFLQTTSPAFQQPSSGPPNSPRQIPEGQAHALSHSTL